MLNYEQIKAFATLLEQDQAPQVDPETKEVIRNAYDEGQHIYTINFTVCSVTGEVTTKVHIQWGLMEQLLLHVDREVWWNTYELDCIHLHMSLKSQPGVEYTTVLFRDDLRTLWERINSPLHPFPEHEPLADVWATLYKRGVWEV